MDNRGHWNYESGKTVISTPRNLKNILFIFFFQFSQIDHLKEALLATKGTILVEASPRDRIWGIGLGEEKARKLGKKGWRGKNWLGYALTDVRETLLSQEEKPKEDTNNK